MTNRRMFIAAVVGCLVALLRPRPAMAKVDRLANLKPWDRFSLQDVVNHPRLEKLEQWMETRPDPSIGSHVPCLYCIEFQLSNPDVKVSGIGCAEDGGESYYVMEVRP